MVTHSAWERSHVRLQAALISRDTGGCRGAAARGSVPIDIVEDFISPVGTEGRPGTTFTYVMQCRCNAGLVDGVVTAPPEDTVDDARTRTAHVRRKEGTLGLHKFTPP